MGVSGEFVLMGVLVGFFLLVGILLYAVGNKKQKAKRLGFVKVGRDEELSAHLRQIYVHGDTKDVKARSVWRLDRGDYRVYRQKIVKRSGTETEYDVFPGALCVVSSRLSLPNFSLVPRFSSGGKILQVLMGWVDRMIEKSGKTLKMIDDPEFNEHYFLIADNGFGSGDFFNDRLVSGLLSLSQVYRIDAAGDTFLFHSYSSFQDGLSSARNRDSLESQLQMADKLFTLFYDSHMDFY